MPIMMAEEPFARGPSCIHRISPVHRLLAATGYIMLVAVFDDMLALSAAIGCSAVMIQAAKLSWRLVLRRLIAVNGLILFIWVVLPLTYEGEPLAHLGLLTFYRPGVRLSAAITLKSNAILLCFIALVATIPLAVLGHTLRRLHAPDKLVYILLMTYRYLSVIEQEFTRLHRAAKIRGFQARTNVHTYRTYGYLLAMVFVRAWSRAERVYQAMLCRGFHGRFYHLAFGVEKQTGSRLFAFFMLSAMIALVLLEYSRG
jgi:cobalt/nickel transport system permease protein